MVYKGYPYLDGLMYSHREANFSNAERCDLPVPVLMPFKSSVKTRAGYSFTKGFSIVNVILKSRNKEKTNFDDSKKTLVCYRPDLKCFII